ncbi:MAG: hypothetical protein ACK559_28155 [bacterium]
MLCEFGKGRGGLLPLGPVCPSGRTRRFPTWHQGRSNCKGFCNVC